MKDILEHIQNSKESYQILNSNFREKYDEIEDCIKNAAVISIDSEFSGLTFSSKYKNSLFDNGEERYNILKKNIENFIVIQIGLTVFNFDREENQYTARMYNFFIFPRAVASIDNRFACQSSSLQFLAKNSFDFNKFVYEGIPYLNEKQEEILVKELSQGNLFHQVERNIPLEDERVVQKLISEISVWSLSSKINDTTVLEHELLVGNQLLVFLIHKEIRERFDYLWTSIPPSSPYKISVIKVEADDRNKLKTENSGVLERNVVDFFLGFSKLFKLLIALKKPIVGHNILLDLMILYNQFYEPLPNNYHTFKKKVNNLFPRLFDTKYISYELKKVVRREDMWVSNAVLDLYKYFSEGRGREATLYRPDIKLMSQNVENLNPGILLHEAGWDSYICGYCFIQMGHYFACATYGRDSYRRPLSSTEHINGVLKFMNKINIVRGSIPFIDLEGDDPPSNRPRRLLVKTKTKSSIDIIEVTEMLAKYCSVDIKPLDQQRVLVAVASYPGARQILKNFLNHEKYKISVYHPLRDSKTVEVILWSGLLLSSGLCVGALLRNLAAR